MQTTSVFFGIVGVDYGPVMDHLSMSSRAQLSTPPRESRPSLKSEQFDCGTINTDYSCPPGVVC
jgi:hypothetical protein